ncbi:MAG: hypothetical protein RLZZ494_1125 [Pseudomonadota bacterium]
MGRGSIKALIVRKAEIPQRRWDAAIMFICVACMSWLGRRAAPLAFLLRAEVGLTRLLGLFDRDHYLAQIHPGALRGLSPLTHYVRHGDAAGLSPSPLFDARHYDAHCGRRWGLNRLLHYALMAHFRWLSPTPWFDPQYYLRRCVDVGTTAVEAVRHFQHHGWREGRSPLPGLDIRKALHTLSELRPVKGNPLSLLRTEDILRLHHTQDAADSILPEHVLGDDPEAQVSAFWADMPSHARQAPVQVDVVLHVTTALPQTLRCLRQLLCAPIQAPWRLLVIYNEHEDSDTAAWLRSLAARDLLTWLPPVEGPVAGSPVQFLHALHRVQARDVVLLDSHVLVHGDWLDRLLRHFEAMPDVGALCALSDDGGLAAYPEMFSAVPVPLESSPADMDMLAAQINAQGLVRMPTLLPPGLLLLRRLALKDGGLPRSGSDIWGALWAHLQAHGWSSAVACNVFVGVQRTAGERGAAEPHPPMADPVLADFIASDPLGPWRARLDVARLRRMCRQRNALLVCHSRGGGTERHLLEQTEQLLARGWGVFELRPVARTRSLSLRHFSLFGLPNLGHISLDDEQMLTEVLSLLHITDLHVHHLIDFPPDAVERLVALARQLKLRVHVAVHDYYLVCPRVNMVSQQGRFCGEPDTSACNRCLSDGPTGPNPSITAWRRAWLPLLHAAERVVVPSHDVAERLHRMLPAPIPLVVQAHEAPPSPGLSALRAVRPGEPLKVLVIGAISRIKGFEVLLALARTVREQGLNLEVSLLGFSPEDGRLAGQGVRLLGPYFDADLPERIKAAQPHLIWIPSIWPETYCYVLSAALRSGTQVAVFDLGAQAERVRAHDERHLCLPLTLADDPLALANALLAGSLSLSRTV